MISRLDSVDLNCELLSFLKICSEILIWPFMWGYAGMSFHNSASKSHVSVW